MSFDPSKEADMVGYFAGEVLNGMVSRRFPDDASEETLIDVSALALALGQEMARQYTAYRQGKKKPQTERPGSVSVFTG